MLIGQYLLASEPSSVHYVTAHQGSEDISSRVQVFTDIHNLADLDAIVAGEYDQRFGAVSGDFYRSRERQARHWFKVALKARSAIDSGEYVLHVDSHPSRIPHLGLALVSLGSVKQVFETGSHLPFDSRDIDESKPYAFRLQLNAEQPLEIVGWIDAKAMPGAVLLPLKVHSVQNFNAVKHQSDLLQTAFYAALAVLLLYNLFLYISLRQKLYAFYVIFLTTSIGVCMAIDGSIYHVFPNYPAGVSLGKSMGVVLAILAYTAFLFYSLDKFQYYPRYRFYYLIAFVLGGILLLSLPLVDTYYQVVGSRVYAVTLLILNAGVILHGVIRKVYGAVSLLFADVAFVLGGSVYMLTVSGFFPPSAWSMWSLHIGFLCETLLLSLVLANLTRRVQNENITNLEKYRVLYNNAIEGLFQYSFVDGSVTCNRSMAELFGYTDVDVFLRTEKIIELVKGAVDHEMNTRLMREGFVSDYELTLKIKPPEGSKTAARKRCSISMNLTRNNTSGGAKHVEGSIVDITQRYFMAEVQRRTLRAQNEAIDNLKKSEQLKSDFLSMLSHELRTPMTGVSGYIELLIDEDLTDDQEDVVGGARRCTKEMMRLLDRVLEFAQLHAGARRRVHTPFSLAELLEPIRIDIAERCRSKRLVFNWHIDDGIAKALMGDKNKIAYVLKDLLDNAAKFTNAGYVALSAFQHESVDKGRVDERSVDRDNDDCDEETKKGVCGVTFRIEDSGDGIDEEMRSHLFDSFNLGDASFSRKFGGMGLGLAICRQYVELLGGNLTYRPGCRGKGSCFEFTIDLERTSATSLIEEHFIASSRGKSANILIVEDNLTNQMILESLIKKIGHRTTTAENGSVALEKLEKEHFDLILMDCQMPVMDGFEATERIRQSELKFNHLPIIAVTANVMENDKDRCFSAGMNDFLPKPISKDILSHAISKWLVA